MTETYVLKFSCKDQPGIVAAVTCFFADQGFNIEESAQYQDPQTGRFFMRTLFNSVKPSKISLEQLKIQFASIADDYSMDWELHNKEHKMRVLIAVSKWGHCLNNILVAWKAGTLPIDIVGVVSNHQEMCSMVEWFGLPYRYLPITKDTKAEQEQQILQEMEDTKAELLILARYMQILSNDLCNKLKGRAINIHHSFLPGFKGAKPFHQAHRRGVKLIGATAHYVTADLDEGPIIEQAVERVTHSASPEDMMEISRDIEAVVLNRAVRWHAEYRLFNNENKTVVFR